MTCARPAANAASNGPSGARTSRRDRPDPSRSRSARPPRRAAGRRPGSASPCRRRSAGRAARPGSRGCRRRRAGSRARRPRRSCARSAPSAARSRGRPWGGGRRGSRRRGTPAARCRRTRGRAPRRRWPPSPIGSGHADSPLGRRARAGPLDRWRGSEEIVTGMPRRVDSASRCSRFDHSAVHRGSGRVDVEVAQVTVARRARRAAAAERARALEQRCRRRAMTIGGWNISPAFSSSVIWPSRSSTRSSSGRVGSSYGIEPAVAVQVAKAHPVADLLTA